MFYCTITVDLICMTMLYYFMRIIYTAFCTQEIIFKSVEGNGRKIVMQRMSLKQRCIIKLIS